MSKSKTIARKARAPKSEATPPAPAPSPKSDLKPVEASATPARAPTLEGAEGAADAFYKMLVAERATRAEQDARRVKIARAAEMTVLSALGEFAEFVRHSGVEIEDDDGGWLRSATFHTLANLARARAYALALGGATVLPYNELEIEL
jgi:hypothetical protein